MQLFWLLGFTVVAKKKTFSVEFLLPWKKTQEKNSEKNKQKKQLFFFYIKHLHVKHKKYSHQVYI